MRLTVLALAGTLSCAFAGDLGGTPGWLGRMGGGTREFALGNAAGAIEPTALDAWWNPARLPMRNGTDLSLAAEQRPLDREGGSIGIASNVGTRLGVGAALLYRRDGNVNIYDEDENQTGTSSPYFMQVQIGLGARITRNQSVGISFGIYREDLDLDGYPSYSAPARIDLSWLYRGRDTLWAAGVVLRNVGLTSDLVAHEDRNATSTASGSLVNEGIVARTLEVSGRYRLHPRAGQDLDLLLTPVVNFTASEFFATSGVTSGLRAGLEYTPQCWWQLRAGYEQGSWGAGGSLRLYPWADSTATGRRSLWLDYAAMLERETGASLLSVGLRGSL